MKPISELIQVRETPEQKNKALSERNEILQKFIERINGDRKKDGYRAYTPGFIASRMYKAGYKTTSQLWMFWGSCNDATTFSATWHYKTDLKKVNK